MTRRVVPTSERPLSIDEFERLPETVYRTELVRGRLVREPPAGGEHGWLDFEVGSPIHRHVKRHGLGVVFGAETGFILSEDPPTVRAPDVAFVAAERIPDDGVPTGFFPGAPDLAVEILSPSNTASEVQEKITDYLEAGSRMVWIVDPRRRTVTVYRSRSDIRILAEDERLEGGDVLPGFRLGVGEMFGR